MLACKERNTRETRMLLLRLRRRLCINIQYCLKIIFLLILFFSHSLLALFPGRVANRLCRVFPDLVPFHPMMKRFENKAVLITGASRGIGHGGRPPCRRGIRLLVTALLIILGAIRIK